MELKRRLELPSPETVGSVFKRQKVQHPINPLIYSIPPTIIPIINHPNKVTDFFTDLPPPHANYELFNNQIANIVSQFPPPLPPLPPPVDRTTGEDQENAGIMVPFIYPPPPIVNRDSLPYSINHYRHNLSLYDSAKNSNSLRKLKTFKKMIQNTNENWSKNVAVDYNSQENYLIVPPLPFPPLNYMPYPLNADKSALTPDDVFSTFLQANEVLPRIDMIVASAAGSLFDIKDQAQNEGFNIEKYKQFKLLQLQNDKSKNKTNSSDDEDNDYANYIENIDVVEYYDNYDQNPTLLPYTQEDVIIHQNLSSMRCLLDSKKSKPQETLDALIPTVSDFEFPVSSSDIISNPNKDVITANGIHKEKRRHEVSKSITELEEYEQQHREQIYLAKKQQLLKKLKDLESSKISFSDPQIIDKDLQEYDRDMQICRDEELLRLKLEENYEMLKSSLIFYQDSNRIYKNLNAIMINKLEKLKGFFEFQRNLFNDILTNRNSEFLDVKHKDAVKLYGGLSHHNYANEITHILKESLDEATNANEATDGNNPVEQLSTPVHPRQNLMKLSKGILSVYDFMPLITPGEFNIITGDIPSQKPKNSSTSSNKQAISIKHQIFKSPLYDKATSGSDSNMSESSATPTIKRRGRRANNPQNGPPGTLPGFGGGDKSDNSKYSEAALLAKIMKHFYGPQGANAEEYQKDLKLMGIKSVWPPLQK